MTGRKTRALSVPPVVPYKALENFSKALYRTTGGTYGARIIRPVMNKRAPMGILKLVRQNRHNNDRIRSLGRNFLSEDVE